MLAVEELAQALHDAGIALVRKPNNMVRPVLTAKEAAIVGMALDVLKISDEWELELSRVQRATLTRTINKLDRARGYGQRKESK